MRRFLVLVLTLSFIYFSQCADWDYDDQDKWPETCTKGSSQSPIDIYHGEAINLQDLQKLKFNAEYSHAISGTVKNNGHSIQIILNNSTGYLSVAGGGLKGSYILDSFHFHWNSEHTVENYRYPIEGHFVHYAKKYETLENAQNYKDGILVVAVFYETSPVPNPAFDNLIYLIPEIAHNLDEAKDLLYPVTADDFLPENTYEYFRYQGSLTTPPCTEVVTWIIFSTPSYISPLQMVLFEQVYDGHDHLINYNFRQHQEKNDRELYFVC